MNAKWRNDPLIKSPAISLFYISGEELFVHRDSEGKAFAIIKPENTLQRHSREGMEWML